MFNKSPENLWAAVFNVPQGLTMTIAMCLYLGRADFVTLCRTFVCAYCAGSMLTLFLRIPAFGAWFARLFRCRGGVAEYLVSGAAAGALMGALINFFISFMNIGPTPEYPAAFLHALPFSILVSIISSWVWVCIVDRLVEKVCGRK